MSVTTSTRARVACVTSYVLGDDAASWRAANVATALHDLGCAVHLMQHVRRAAGQPAGAPARLVRGVPCSRLESSRAGSLVHLDRIVRRERFDLILGNNINGTLLGLLARVRVPVILDMHGDMVAELDLLEPVSSLSSRARRWGRRTLYRLADATALRISNRISCVSRTMMSVLRDRGVANHRLVYAPNCVDLAMFRPHLTDQSLAIRRTLGIPPDARLFGYLGRFHGWQGVDNFVAAARSIVRDDLRFLILGGDHTSTQGHLHFVRKVPLLEMPRYYAACDVLVLPRPDHPATRVAAPTKFAEYTAMGRPVLTTDVGDAAQLVRHYGCGTVAPSNSVEDLRHAILAMADLDHERLGDMGEASRRLAEQEFSFDVAAHNLASCIDELVTSR